MIPALALLAASCAAAAADADTRLAAQKLERRLEVLTAAMHEQRDDFALRSVTKAGLLAALHNMGADALMDPRMRRDARALAEDYRKSSVELAVETTVIAVKLKAYRETGVIPDAVPDMKEIRAALTSWDPPKSKSGKPQYGPKPLPQDLNELMREVQRFEAFFAAHVPRPASRESLPAPAAPPARAPAPAVQPAFMRDAGEGRAESDPLPELLAQLASPDPRQRALAADGLVGRGASAAKAIPALKAALGDPDARVRSSAVQALAAVAGIQAEADIRRALGDKDEDVRFSARAALRALESPGGSLQSK